MEDEINNILENLASTVLDNVDQIKDLNFKSIVSDLQNQEKDNKFGLTIMRI